MKIVPLCFFLVSYLSWFARIFGIETRKNEIVVKVNVSFRYFKVSKDRFEKEEKNQRKGKSCLHLNTPFDDHLFFTSFIIYLIVSLRYFFSCMCVCVYVIDITHR